MGAELPQGWSAPEGRLDRSGGVLLAQAAGDLVSRIGDDQRSIAGPERDPVMLAAAILQLADSPAWRAKLGRQAMEAARARTWEAAMNQLADGYDRVTEPADRPRISLVRAA